MTVGYEIVVQNGRRLEVKYGTVDQYLPGDQIYNTIRFSNKYCSQILVSFIKSPYVNLVKKYKLKRSTAILTINNKYLEINT